MSLPLTISIRYNTCVKPQAIVWDYFLNNHSFIGTHMKPGHVYSFRHLDIDLSRNDTQSGVDFFSIFLFH